MQGENAMKMGPKTPAELREEADNNESKAGAKREQADRQEQLDEEEAETDSEEQE
jgi:hypothetical protein